MTICNSVSNIIFNLEKMLELEKFDEFLIRDTLKEVKYIHSCAIKMENRLRRYLKAFISLGFQRIRK